MRTPLPVGKLGQCERLDALGRSARVAAARLWPHANEVLVFGPLPRLAREVFGESWDSTTAFNTERTLKHTEGVRLIQLGSRVVPFSLFFSMISYGIRMLV